MHEAPEASEKPWKGKRGESEKVSQKEWSCLWNSVHQTLKRYRWFFNQEPENPRDQDMVKALMFLEHKAGAEKERGEKCKWRGNSGQRCLTQDYISYFGNPRDPAKMLKWGSIKWCKCAWDKKREGALSARQTAWRDKQWRFRNQLCGYSLSKQEMLRPKPQQCLQRERGEVVRISLYRIEKDEWQGQRINSMRTESRWFCSQFDPQSLSPGYTISIQCLLNKWMNLTCEGGKGKDDTFFPLSSIIF